MEPSTECVCHDLRFRLAKVVGNARIAPQKKRGSCSMIPN
jgi:hypothetical protein